MLDMGFGKSIREIFETEGMRPVGERQTMLFSATFPEAIQQMASDFMRDYVFITVGRVGSTSENITQKAIFVEEDKKTEKLMELLKENLEKGLILVFLKSKRTADLLDHHLRY